MAICPTVPLSTSRCTFGDLSDGAVVYQPLHVRQFAGVHQWANDFPVGGVPADHQDFGVPIHGQSRASAANTGVV